MGTPDLQHMRQAWRDASSGDVVRALRVIDEYPPAAAEIIRAEADSRGLDVDSEDALSQPAYAGARMLMEAARPAGRFVGERLGELRRSLNAHPHFYAVVCGMFTLLLYWFVPMRLGAVIGYGIANILVMGVYLAGLGTLCYPLHRYRRAWITAAVAGGTYTLGALVFLAVRNQVDELMLPPAYFLRATASWSGFHVVAPALLLTAAVYVRRRFWPYHEPGVCRVCEYDLRGLPEPRCPECGTPFDPAELAGVD